MRWITIFLASTLILGACESAPTADLSKGEILVELREHTIKLSSPEVRAGQVTFLVRNRGGVAHDFIVLRTDSAHDKLPQDQQKAQAVEEGRVDGLKELPPGRSGQLRVDLAAGQYVLICNVATHYQLGMHLPFTVK